MQQRVERWLDGRLSSAWALWASRSQIEGNTRIAIYYFRNWALGIKPTTIRKVIKIRYKRNMDAFRDILEDYKARRIPVVLYIAPIRQDKQLPYDQEEYRQWKEEVSSLSRAEGARLINLETLVPPGYWGSYHGNDVDFMHFQGPGHKMVAEALAPHVKAIEEGTR